MIGIDEGWVSHIGIGNRGHDEVPELLHQCAVLNSDVRLATRGTAASSDVPHALGLGVVCVFFGGGSRIYGVGVLSFPVRASDLGFRG